MVIGDLDAKLVSCIPGLRTYRFAFLYYYRTQRDYLHSKRKNLNLGRLSSKKRSTWARKWLRRRRQRSIYSNLVQELREEDPDEYLKYLRMTTTT
jgi:hypothetical protein